MTFASTTNNNAFSLSDLVDFNSLGISFGIGSFGGVIFQVSSSHVSTFDELTRRVSAKFADHDVAGQKPISEQTGEELDEITFNMTFSSQYCKPEQELLKLNRILSSGVANRLIIGSRNLGKFTLREFEENLTHVGKNGKLLFVNVSVTLVEFVDSFSNNALTAQREDAARRGETGKGGPERLPGSPPASRERPMTPNIPGTESGGADGE